MNEVANNKDKVTYGKILFPYVIMIMSFRKIFSRNRGIKKIIYLTIQNRRTFKVK